MYARLHEVRRTHALHSVSFHLGFVALTDPETQKSKPMVWYGGC